MDPLNSNVVGSAQDLINELVSYAESMLLPSRFLQVALLVGLFLLAWLLAALIAPRFDAWIRDQASLSKSRLRFLVVLRNRLRGLFFVAMAWVSVAGIYLYTPFPSRRYIVVLWATIATAWVIIGLVTRLISNPLMRRFVTWLGWIYVTLLYLGFLQSASTFLDSLSLSFGDFRISALGVFKAVVVTGALFAGARLITQGAARKIARNRDIAPSFGVLAVKVMQVVLYGAAFFLGLKAVGFDLTGLAVLSGAIGVGLGFGLQKVVSNLVSGIIILLDKSIKPGDVISLGDTFGWIESSGRALCFCRDPRWPRIPDSQRRSHHRTSGELVSFQRVRAHRPRFRHLLSRRPAQSPPGRSGRCPVGGPCVENPRCSLPYHQFWR